MTAARTLTDADLEALRGVIRAELEARTRRRVRPADVVAAPKVVVDEVSRARAKRLLSKHGLGRSKVRAR